MENVSFDNTEIAFQHRSDGDLKKSRWLFSLFTYKAIIRFGPALAVLGLKLRLPIKGLIRNTIFGQFCGGESIAECHQSAEMLHDHGIGSILDYSVEGVDEEASFDQNYLEIRKTIEISKVSDEYPFAVFKPTGIGRLNLLAKVQSKTKLTPAEEIEYLRIQERFHGLCKHASENEVRLFVDAEDSWIQDPIDELAADMMAKYNVKRAIIFNTLQMYRKDRLQFLESSLKIAKDAGYHLGFKLVRGAYMEKERERAGDMDYPSPIHDTKEDTDRAYDDAVKLCFENRDFVSMCVGTHNEKSSHILVDLMNQNNISVDDERFWFAQLYGMSDNISFNLSHSGYNVAKYLPYGPIVTVMPYLGRRAQENSSVAGQVGREMLLIVNELERRRLITN
jgi:proline dehydrogenase